MFRTHAVIPSIVVFLAASTGGDSARADDAADYMAQALVRVAATVFEVSSRGDFGYDQNISLLGAMVGTGQSVSLVRELHGSQTYAFIGNGDRDAIDVDIDVFDPLGTRIAFDHDSSALAVVKFTPAYTGRYTIALRLDRAATTKSFCALAILRRGGWNVPPQNLGDAAGRCLERCKAAARQAGTLRFLDYLNQWSLFGAVQEQGEEVTLANFAMGNGERVFVAAGDNHADDIDLYVNLNGSGAVVAKDVDRDSVPMFGYWADGGLRYDVRLKNERSCHASLMFAAVLSR
jgi:hypothetical protein